MCYCLTSTLRVLEALQASLFHLPFVYVLPCYIYPHYLRGSSGLAVSSILYLCAEDHIASALLIRDGCTNPFPLYIILFYTNYPSSPHQTPHPCHQVTIIININSLYS